MFLCVATSEFQLKPSCSRFHNSLHSQDSFHTGEDDEENMMMMMMMMMIMKMIVKVMMIKVNNPGINQIPTQIFTPN